MISTLNLLFHYSRKSFQSIFLGFCLPIILLLIVVPIIRSFNPEHAQYVIPGLVMSVGPILGVVSLAMTYADFKQSIIIKRIGATPLKSYEFISAILIFYVALIFVGSFWVLGFGAAVYFRSIDFTLFNWNYIILAILLLAMMSCPFGLIIGIKARDLQMANAIGFLVYIPTSFLSGQYIPYSAYSRQEALVNVSRAIPFSYPVSIISRAWNNFGDTSNIALIDNYWLPIVVSLAWICGGIICATLLYKYRSK